jgi:hypothetical protein
MVSVKADHPRFSFVFVRLGRNEKPKLVDGRPSPTMTVSVKAPYRTVAMSVSEATADVDWGHRNFRFSQAGFFHPRFHLCVPTTSDIPEGFPEDGTSDPRCHELLNQAIQLVNHQWMSK